jgi:glycosyltransferase involved in cell wall biosynthesis
MRRKRILLMNMGAPFGGVEVYLDNLAGILTEHADVYSICSLPEMASRLRAHGVRVLCLPILGHRWMNFFRFLVGAAIFPFYVLLHGIDTVLMNGYLESLLALPARMLGCQAIRASHGLSEVDMYSWYRSPTKYFPRLASRSFLAVSTKVVCVSETVGRDVMKTVRPDKVFVIPNWVGRLPEQIQLETGRKPLELLFAGRLEQYKGGGLLLEAMRGIEDVHLTIVGKGSYEPELRRMAEGMNVTFAGFSSNIEPFYRGADIFINPTLGPEGLPLVSIESMGYGLPSIFSALPVHKEITDDGRFALLFPVGDAEALRLAIERLAADPAERQTLGNAARERVVKVYSRSVAATAYLQLFEVEVQPA